jgi:hypothetical protein
MTWLFKDQLQQDFAIFNCFKAIVGQGFIGICERLMQEDEDFR